MISLSLIVVSVTAGHGFLFGSPGGFGPGPGGFGGMCTPIQQFCPLKCSAYERDGHGCEICHCKTAGTQLSQPTEHTIHNPCIPSQSLCPLKCEAFVTGPGGRCEYCQCAQTNHQSTSQTTSTPASTTTKAPTTVAPTTNSPATTTAVTAAPTTTDPDCVIAKQICSAKCNGQYLVDPSDCTFCICKSEINGG